MTSSDKKKIIILIIVAIILVGAGFFLVNWQKTMPQLDPAPQDKYAELSQEQQEKLTKAEQKIKDNPDDLISYVELALLQNQFGWTDDAIKTYEKVLFVNPNDVLALNNLANIYKNLKQYEKAEEYFLRIIDFNPRVRVQTYIDLVDIYRFHLTDKRDQIPIILEKGYEHNPEREALFLSHIAVYHKDFGDKEKAIKNYQALLELEPENQTARAELEELLAE